MLEIKGLKKSYGNYHALNGLNLTVGEGELFGFVGPNGAGKTTTIKILAGLLKADGGEVRIDGIDALYRPSLLKSHIGYVPDHFGVYDNLKVSEYMEFYAATYGIYGRKARTKIEELLEMLSLRDRINDYVDGLSRGMKQRLCMARAMIHDPKVLLLDEPSSGLDPRLRFQLKELLKMLNTEGKTILISSHILSELSEMCTDIGVIEDGRLILQGTMVDIRSMVSKANPLEITVCDKLEEAAELLKENPLVKTITIDVPKLMITFEGDQTQEAKLLRFLVERGIPVSSFIRRQSNLETLFMEITDHSEEKVVSSNETQSYLS